MDTFCHGSSFVIVGAFPQLNPLTQKVWQNLAKAFRPSTSSGHRTHFKTYILFLQFMGIPFCIDLQPILAFMQYLWENHLSPKVIQAYLSSLRIMANWYQLEHEALSH